MEGRWVAAESFLPPQGSIVWDVDYTGHPYLDPSLPDRDSRLRRFTEFTWDRIRDDDDAYRRESARLLRPLRGGDDEVPPCAADIAVITEYLQEADVYLYSAIDLLPASAREHVVPLEEINRCHDLRELLAMVFAGGDPRRRFEAQRKVYLANLLLDIDHSRLIQDGPLHLAYFEELLDDALWHYRRQQYEVQIGYHIADDGQTIRYSARPEPDDQIFTFHSSYLERRLGRRKTSLDVLYWNCRFKRSVEPLSFEVVDGRHRVLERVRWGDMRQHRSGPVLSKMIRRGINNPSEIADLLGAMFIVHDEEAVNDLLELLDAGLGNPFGWRNVTDSFSADPTGAGLNRYSGRGYKVIKGDVDILIPGRVPGQPPYRFTVEIQVHTLESFLRTICSTHDANHLALKLRQFLGGLVPYLFPAAVYGQDWLRFDPAPGVPAGS
jgi:hypothetical protein